MRPPESVSLLVPKTPTYCREITDDTAPLDPERPCIVGSGNCPECGLFGGHVGGCTHLVVIACDEPGHPKTYHHHGPRVR